MKSPIWKGLTVLGFATSLYFAWLWDSSKQDSLALDNQLKRQAYQLSLMETNVFEFPPEKSVELRNIRVRNRNKVIAPFSDFVSHQRLILRIDQYHCNTCYEAEFSELKKISDLSELVVLTSMPTRQFTYFVEEFSSVSDRTVFLNLQDEFNLPQDSWGQPYYLRLDKEFKVIETFIPDKVLPEYTRRYLVSRMKNPT